MIRDRSCSWWGSGPVCGNNSTSAPHVTLCSTSLSSPSSSACWFSRPPSQCRCHLVLVYLLLLPKRVWKSRQCPSAPYPEGAMLSVQTYRLTPQHKRVWWFEIWAFSSIPSLFVHVGIHFLLWPFYLSEKKTKKTTVCEIIQTSIGKKT